MVLVDTNIKELVSQGKLIIENYKEENVGPVSYDVTIDKIIVEEEEVINYKLEPKEYIFIKTREKFSIPNNLSGRVFDKNSLLRIGLDVSKITYFPGHTTYLFLRVFNMSNTTITLEQGFKIAQIGFEELKEAPDVTYDKTKKATFQNEEQYKGTADYKEQYDGIINKQ